MSDDFNPEPTSVINFKPELDKTINEASCQEGSLPRWITVADPQKSFLCRIYNQRWVTSRTAQAFSSTRCPATTAMRLLTYSSRPMEALEKASAVVMVAGGALNWSISMPFSSQDCRT